MFTFSSNHWEWDGRCMWEKEFYVFVSWNDVFVTHKDRRLGFGTKYHRSCVFLVSTQSVSWRQVSPTTTDVYHRVRLTSSVSRLQEDMGSVITEYDGVCIHFRVWWSVMEGEFVRIQRTTIFFFSSCLTRTQTLLEHSRVNECVSNV